jgi:site-specific recombinase XerD
VFTARGTTRKMSTDAVAERIKVHAAAAAAACPGIAAKNVTPHVLRHYADGWVMCPAVAFPLLGAAEPVL